MTIISPPTRPVRPSLTIGEVALAYDLGSDAVAIGKTIHPHPTLGELIGMAAEVAHGSCTDLPPALNQTTRQPDNQTTTAPKASVQSSTVTGSDILLLDRSWHR